MTCTASHAIEQLIIDTAAKLGGKSASVQHSNTILSE